MVMFCSTDIVSSVLPTQMKCEQMIDNDMAQTMILLLLHQRTANAHNDYMLAWSPLRQ